MSFPRYPTYKDSGVEWLGRVPGHWEICALKRIINMQSGASITSEAIEEIGDYPVFGGNGLRGYTTSFTHDGKFVLIGRQGALCGNINYAIGMFWASEHAVVATPIKQVETFWLGEMLRSMNLNQYSVAAAQPGLSVDLVGRLNVCLPPLREQTQIGTFLDRETKKIDGLVAEQRRLMELLKEKRQAVISHAVTKGLNPDAPMKSSGIEWLGEVPAHWEIGRVKDYFQTCSGGTPNTAQQELYYTKEESGIPWVRTTDLQNDILRVVEIFITKKALADTACAVLPPGTVMIAMYGGGGTVGKNGLLAISAAINQAVCGLLPSTTHSPEYTFRFMQFYRPHWMIGAESSRKDPNISQERVRNAPFPKPPRDEQDAIVNFIHLQLYQFDNLNAEAQRVIDLLQERRIALISAAVTGQIDVREFA